jgi:hypothetical protein
MFWNTLFENAPKPTQPNSLPRSNPGKRLWPVSGLLGPA